MSFFGFDAEPTEGELDDAIRRNADRRSVERYAAAKEAGNLTTHFNGPPCTLGSSWHEGPCP